ncbi:hypothetical protein [Salinibius halmophilus]|uniref:hypothetical protein n=1 Tax=Salinibius halmophilus TaxID=1853216 RepID=UPI000E668EB3|nr:hypothetical protein [Salinibius halmophilus]
MKITSFPITQIKPVASQTLPTASLSITTAANQSDTPVILMNHKSLSHAQGDEFVSTVLAMQHGQKNPFKNLDALTQYGLKQGESFRASFSTIDFTSNGDPIDDLKSIERLVSGQQAKDGVSLSLTTSDGDEVSIRLSHVKSSRGGALSGLSFEFSVQGELSEEEQQAITQVASSWQSQIDRLTKGDMPDMSLFKDLPSNITALNMAVNVGRNEFSVALSQVDGEKQITAKLNGHQASMTVDLTTVLATNEAKRQAAVAHYVGLLEDAGQRSKADDKVVDFFSQTFAMMQSVPVAEPKTTDFQAQRDESLLSGLADYQFDFSAKRQRLNFYPGKEHEVVRFDVSGSQETSVSGEWKERLIKQTQTLELTSSFYEPLPGWQDIELGMTADKQNYRYVELNEAVRKTSEQQYKDGELDYASMLTEQSQSRRVRDYLANDLIKDDHQQQTSVELKDFTDEIKAASLNLDLELLDEVLIQWPDLL